MNDNQSPQLGDLEKEFRAEEKGQGSYNPRIVGGTDDQDPYVGYDITPEDIEALFFDGIGIPRWESIKADSIEQQEALYMERFNELMAKYPMIGRANDTEQKAEYTSGEIAALLDECTSIASGSSNPKALR
ncbi:MAG: hypothetical protein ACRD43_13120, partial [Pyrinomonadaceae bacterium]